MCEFNDLVFHQAYPGSVRSYAFGSLENGACVHVLKQDGKYSVFQIRSKKFYWDLTKSGVVSIMNSFNGVDDE